MRTIFGTIRITRCTTKNPIVLTHSCTVARNLSRPTECVHVSLIFSEFQKCFSNELLNHFNDVLHNSKSALLPNNKNPGIVFVRSANKFIGWFPEYGSTSSYKHKCGRLFSSRILPQSPPQIESFYNWESRVNSFFPICRIECAWIIWNRNQIEVFRHSNAFFHTSSMTYCDMFGVHLHSARTLAFPHNLNWDISLCRTICRCRSIETFKI